MSALLGSARPLPLPKPFQSAPSGFRSLERLVLQAAPASLFCRQEHQSFASSPSHRISMLPQQCCGLGLSLRRTGHSSRAPFVDSDCCALSPSKESMALSPIKTLPRRVQVVVATTVLLSFISFWR